MVYLKRSFYILSLSIFILCAESANAYIPQRGNVTAYLGPYWFKTNYDGVRSEDNQANVGAALIASGDVSDKGALELGTIFMNKYYFREEGAYSIAERTQTLHITIAYRRYWAPSFSTSLGLYTSYPMGDVKTIHDDYPTDWDKDTSAHSTTESGLDFALQGEVWTSGLWSVMAEARYSYAITKKAHEYSDQYAYMIALKYFIQARVENPKTLKEIPPKPPELKTETETKQDKTPPTSKSPPKPKNLK
ncbi:hypothetical protein [Bdellovibrio sp. HCB209]|uniref:hypothetical protein n=1 Tax=Bdellovibrio sp. HCB209 TaxID=3394354 RepID=UPI0039B49632